MGDSFLKRKLHRTSQIQTQQQTEEQKNAPLLEESLEAVQQIQQNVQLREEDFEVIEGELIPAEQMFTRQESNLHRQKDQKKIRESGKKSEREKAATEQKEADRIQLSKINCNVGTMQRDNGDDIMRQTVIAMEDKKYREALKEGGRVDVTGHLRRSNEQKYAASNPKGVFMRKAARADVDNLVRNLRMDIVLEGDGSTHEELSPYVDAYYMVNALHEAVGIQKKREIAAMKNDGRSTKEQIDEANKNYDKFADLSTILKSKASNFAITTNQIHRALRARKLARKQILDEGISAYHMLMVQMLDADIATLQREYDQEMENLRTLNHTLDTPKGAATVLLREQLAELRRQMKADDVTGEQKQEIMDQAFDLILNFDHADNPPAEA